MVRRRSRRDKPWHRRRSRRRHTTTETLPDTEENTDIKEEEEEEEHIWEKKYTKNGARESDASFNVFQMTLKHPTMTYKQIGEETGIPVPTIYLWANKYKYAERRLAKAEYETKILNNLELESKVIIVKKNILRNLVDEDLLDAYAEFNKKLIGWLDVDVIDTGVLKKQQTVNKHLNEYLDLRNKHLRNTLDTEELIKTLAKRGGDVEDEELKGLAGALLRSYQKIEEGLKR